jgi:hypothetical protein
MPFLGYFEEFIFLRRRMGERPRAKALAWVVFFRGLKPPAHPEGQPQRQQQRPPRAVVGRWAWKWVGARVLGVRGVGGGTCGFWAAFEGGLGRFLWEGVCRVGVGGGRVGPMRWCGLDGGSFDCAQDDRVWAGRRKSEATASATARARARAKARASVEAGPPPMAKDDTSGMGFCDGGTETFV